MAEARSSYEAAQQIEDVTERRRASASAFRDMKYHSGLSDLFGGRQTLQVDAAPPRIARHDAGALHAELEAAYKNVRLHRTVQDFLAAFSQPREVDEATIKEAVIRAVTPRARDLAPTIADSELIGARKVAPWPPAKLSRIMSGQRLPSRPANPQRGH